MEHYCGIILLASGVLSLGGDHIWLAMICWGIALFLLTIHWIFAIALVVGGIVERSTGQKIRAFIQGGDS